MKANEAPEKIFLEWYRIGDKKYRDWCIIPKTNNEPVEYTRTDAVTEKVLTWLNNCFITHDEYGVISTQFDTEEEMFEDFRNYLKGE